MIGLSYTWRQPRSRGDGDGLEPLKAGDLLRVADAWAKGEFTDRKGAKLGGSPLVAVALHPWILNPELAPREFRRELLGQRGELVADIASLDARGILVRGEGGVLAGEIRLCPGEGIGPVPGKEYDELKRAVEGERGPGRPEIGHRVTDLAGWSLQRTAEDLGSASSGERLDITRSQCEQVPWSLRQTADDLGISLGATVVQTLNNGFSEGWSLRKTADDLGISLGATHRAIKIATAIEQFPDLAVPVKGQQGVQQGVLL